MTSETPQTIFDPASDAIRRKDRRRGTFRFNSVPGWCLGLLLMVLVSPGVGAQTADAPRTLRVVLDINYPPYSFQSDAGHVQGILVDQWRAWEMKTGIKVELHAMNWPTRRGACGPANSM